LSVRAISKYRLKEDLTMRNILSCVLATLKPFTEYTVEHLDAFLGYLRGTFVLTQSAVRAIRRQPEGGAIINVSPILALNGVAGLPSSAP
jgi:NAD(P)-dependent dehydrogenase (short-subunit alcohol dehydrogenase family)